MKYVIVYAHPYQKSFNNAILQAITHKLTNKKIDFNVIDLYRDGFNPTYSKQELALSNCGKTTDPLVTKYQHLIKTSTAILFIFPIWWNSVPAIIKGFIDKTMKKNFAYHCSSTGIKPILNNIKKTRLISTSSSSKSNIKLKCGNSIMNVFMNTTLKELGFQNRKWTDFDLIDQSSPQRRKKFLNLAPKLVLE